MSLIVDEHREYLSDRPRIAAFRKAIREVVMPGDAVVDLGSGSGILGLLACQAGAKHVYSVDEGSIVELIRDIARANRVEDRLHVVKGLSTRITLPEPAGVIVADQIGRFGFDAGILEYFADARRRLLRPDARAIPSHIDLWVAPVSHPTLWQQIEFWAHRPAGFDFSPARAIAANTGYPVKLSRTHLLGKPLAGISLDTLAHGSRPINFSVTIPATRAGVLHGIGGWFSARLSPTVTMTNSPLARQRINRRNAFFPIDPPVRLARGSRVNITFSILPKEVVVTWSAEIHSRQTKNRSSTIIAGSTHSTIKGMLISTEDLMRTHPNSTPALSPWGKARQTVLELCTGGRQLSDIERAVWQQHPDLFPSLADAATFTAEVVTRYAR